MKIIDTKKGNCTKCINAKCHVLGHDNGRSFFGGGPRGIWHVCQIEKVKVKVTDSMVCENFTAGTPETINEH